MNLDVICGMVMHLMVIVLTNSRKKKKKRSFILIFTLMTVLLGSTIFFLNVQYYSYYANNIKLNILLGCSV